MKTKFFTALLACALFTFSGTHARSTEHSPKPKYLYGLTLGAGAAFLYAGKRVNNPDLTGVGIGTLIGTLCAILENEKKMPKFLSWPLAMASKNMLCEVNPLFPLGEVPPSRSAQAKGLAAFWPSWIAYVICKIKIVENQT